MTPEEFKARFPEFDSVPVERVQTFLDEASLSINPSVWANKTDVALMYLTAHLLAADKQGNLSGMVTSEKVGDLSRTYAQGSVVDSCYGSTRYGIEFMRLRKSVCLTPFVL